MTRGHRSARARGNAQLSRTSPPVRYGYLPEWRWAAHREGVAG